MRSLLSIGALLVLFHGIVPAHAVHAWWFDGPVCREACAGTDHCCCKRRQQGCTAVHGDHVPTTLDAPREPCCTDSCGATTALQRLPVSRVAFRAEIEQPWSESSVREPGAVFPPLRREVAPARPRAPPA